MNVESPEFIQNPYPFYAQRRTLGGALNVKLGVWTLTGYAELSEALQNSAAGRGNIGADPVLPRTAKELEALRLNNSAVRLLDQWMLFKNPPEHTKIRGKVAKQMTARVISKLEPTIRAVLQELYANIKQKSGSRFELVSQIAYPLPSRVIGELLGVPAQNQARFAELSKIFTKAVEVDYSLLAPAQLAHLNAAADELSSLFSQLIERDSGETKSLIDRLMADDGAALSEHEVLANCVFLLFAGLETTAFALSNSVYSFLLHPEQIDLLKNNPGLLDTAVEESLRFDPPIQMVGRYALNDFSIGKYTVKQGSHLFAFLGAAGRDPEANPDPDVFNIERQHIKHLAFARGTHHCLGALLAKLELKIFLETFFEEFPDLKIDGTATRKPTWLMRGFSSLPLAYS